MTISLPSGHSQGMDGVSNLVPPGTEVKWLSVQHSLADLDAVRDKLVERIPDFDRSDAPFATLAISASRNLVELTLDGPVVGPRATLTEEFGDKVSVDRGSRPLSSACTRSACSPWRGGLKITGPGGICTWGFNARHLGGTSLRMLTAGHCGSGTWYQNNNRIGSTTLNNFTSSNHLQGDFQKVPTTFSGTKNLIYIQGTETARAITSIRVNEQQVEGDWVCVSCSTRSRRRTA